MDKHFHLLEQSLEQARLSLGELLNARPTDPRLMRLNRRLALVNHCVEAARNASLDIGAELAHLKDMGVNL